MKNMEKKEYDGLLTTRLTVESPDIMATSKAKVKVKTGTSSTEDWVDVDESTLPTLSTTISSTIE